MWSFRWRSIFWVGLGMVSTVALACGTTTAADAPRSLPDDNPLQRHRQGLGPERVAGQAVQGVVTAVHAGQIVTSIEWAEVRARDIHDGDLVDVFIQGRALPARVFTPESYGRLHTGQKVIPSMDVDVVATPGGDATLVILGLAGDLADFLGAGAGIPVTLQKR